VTPDGGKIAVPYMRSKKSTHFWSSFKIPLCLTDAVCEFDVVCHADQSSNSDVSVFESIWM
jgi:hypothetical protein